MYVLVILGKTWTFKCSISLDLKKLILSLKPIHKSHHE